ncbi:MAG TPA: hypothetical protein VF796_06410 [Humisphaera sp.]
MCRRRRLIAAALFAAVATAAVVGHLAFTRLSYHIWADAYAAGGDAAVTAAAPAAARAEAGASMCAGVLVADSVAAACAVVILYGREARRRFVTRLGRGFDVIR